MYLLLQRIKGLAFAGFFVMFAIMPSSLGAQSIDPAQIRQFLSAQVASGNYDGARQTLASVSRHAADFVLLEVEILTAQGRLDEAIKLLRELTAKNPELTYARAQLAQLLVANRQLDSATHHFEILREQAIDDGERAFFTQQIQNIDAVKTFGLNTQISLTPSSNINGAADRETEQLFFGIVVDLPDELKPQFGWRYSVGVNGYHNLRIKDQHSIRTSFFAQTVMHTVDTIDYSNFTIGAAYKFQNARNDFSIGPFLQRYIGDGEAYLAEFSFTESKATIVERDEDFSVTGVGMSWRYIVNPRQMVGFSAKYSDRRHDDQQRYWSRNSFEHNVGVNYSYFLTPQHLGKIDLSYTRHVEAGYRENWESFNSYTGLGAGVSLKSRFRNQWQTELGLSYRHRSYDELYPLTNLKREDENYLVKFGVLNGNWNFGSMAPKFTCSYALQSSNIDSRNNEGFDCGISMSYDF